MPEGGSDVGRLAGVEASRADARLRSPALAGPREPAHQPSGHGDDQTGHHERRRPGRFDDAEAGGERRRTGGGDGDGVHGETGSPGEMYCLLGVCGAHVAAHR